VILSQIVAHSFSAWLADSRCLQGLSVSASGSIGCLEGSSRPGYVFHAISMDCRCPILSFEARPCTSFCSLLRSGWTPVFETKISSLAGYSSFPQPHLQLLYP
jgi:hypothetical protein